MNKLHRKKVVGRWSARPPTDHLPTTYRPPTDHLPTTYRPPTDHVFTVQLVHDYLESLMVTELSTSTSKSPLNPVGVGALINSSGHTSHHRTVGWCSSKIIHIGNFPQMEIIIVSPSGRWSHLAKEMLVMHDDPQSMVQHLPFLFPFCCISLLSHFFWLIANTWICWMYSQGTREHTEAAYSSLRTETPKIFLKD